MTPWQSEFIDIITAWTGFPCSLHPSGWRWEVRFVQGQRKTLTRSEIERETARLRERLRVKEGK